MIELTARQQQILDFIREFMEAEGFPPTRAEIARALGFRSVNAAEDHLKALVRKGAISVLPGTSRGIRLTGGRARRRGVPIVGRVAAGGPLLAEENVQGHCRLDPGLFRPRADYLLQVRGMSMRDAGILDGNTHNIMTSINLCFLFLSTLGSSNFEKCSMRLRDVVMCKSLINENATRS